MLIQIPLGSGTSSLWYFRGIVKVMHSAAHYPLRQGAAEVVFYQNAALIDGLRFMSTQLCLPFGSFFCVNTHSSPLSLHLFSFHTSTLTTSSSSICCLPHVSYLFAPHLHHLHFLLLFLSLPLHHIFTFQSVPSENLS